MNNMTFILRMILTMFIVVKVNARYFAIFIDILRDFLRFAYFPTQTVSGGSLKLV